MPLEIEIKLKAPSLDAIRGVLTNAGAKWVGLFHETNIFFDRADRSLRAHDRGLRIRLARKDGESTGTTLITFKGPRQKSELAPREAYDIYADPGEQAIPMLEALGFERTHSFEKRRESWEFGGCKIELDELPIFGTFVEIEGPSEEIVMQVRQQLGLTNLAIEKKSYSAMVGNYVREHNVAGGAIVFS